MWPHLIHPGLAHIVKLWYGAELRNKTLASLKTEISWADTKMNFTVMEETRLLGLARGRNPPLA